MKCFHRNETLHKSELVGRSQERKPCSHKALARGMAYARHHLEGRNSLFEGWYNVFFTYPSRSHPDCGRADRSRLWRLQSPDQSNFIQSKASSPDAYGSGIILRADEQQQGSRSEMGTSPLSRRTERFSSDRSGRRYVVAP